MYVSMFTSPLFQLARRMLAHHACTAVTRVSPPPPLHLQPFWSCSVRSRLKQRRLLQREISELLELDAFETRELSILAQGGKGGRTQSRVESQRATT